MIYEDVQKDGGAVDADNGWSSSEFESYEEQSDNEAKPPARSKVELALKTHVMALPLVCHTARGRFLQSVHKRSMV